MTQDFLHTRWLHTLKTHLKKPPKKNGKLIITLIPGIYESRTERSKVGPFQFENGELKPPINGLMNR